MDCISGTARGVVLERLEHIRRVPSELGCTIGRIGDAVGRTAGRALFRSSTGRLCLVEELHGALRATWLVMTLSIVTEASLVTEECGLV